MRLRETIESAWIPVIGTTYPEEEGIVRQHTAAACVAAKYSRAGGDR